MRADRLEEKRKKRKIPAFARENSSISISFVILSNVQLNVRTYNDNKVVKSREKFRYFYLDMINRLCVRGFWIIKVPIKNDEKNIQVLLSFTDFFPQ